MKRTSDYEESIGEIMKHTHRSVALSMLLLMTSLLTACGFQLRGQMNATGDLKQIAIAGENGGGESVFSRYLSRAMENSGIDVSADAPYKIHLLEVEQRSEQENVAIADRYEQKINFSVTYQLETMSGLPLFAPVKLNRERYLTLNENTTNASDSEQAVVFNELRQELIAATLMRISSLNKADVEAEVQRMRNIEKQKKEAVKP
ncbi:hypothetical protein [uncultured Endozoicomonas sp.]|uniref:LPS-assembly lipoprotein LptE n=1 Tax=uncultured Endozoicomonas sp. TaxID=432652 RepID=UPI00261321A3|nr:hypothetical protein [uncultured Endozoicomonas sp.]